MKTLYGKHTENGKIGITFSLILGAVVTVVCAVFTKGVLGIFTDSASVIESGGEYLICVR